MTPKQKAALRQAREAFEYIENNYMSLPAPAIKAIAAIDEALAEQPAQQEPVAYLVYDFDAESQYLAFDEELGDMDGCEVTPLYISSQPSKPWVGLTREERVMCRSYDPEEAVAKTEAKLKEKNT